MGRCYGPGHAHKRLRLGHAGSRQAGVLRRVCDASWVPAVHGTLTGCSPTQWFRLLTDEWVSPTGSAGAHPPPAVHRLGAAGMAANPAPAWLRWAHILSLLYGIAIETGPWPCPLTLAENYFLQRAGIAPYREPFLVHYLEAVVYPDVPPVLLTWCAVAVCGFIVGIYVRRFRHRTASGW